MSDFEVKPGEMAKEQHERILEAARFLAKSMEDMGCERPIVFYAYEAKFNGTMCTSYGRAFDRTRVSDAHAEKNYELIGNLFKPLQDSPI